MAELSRKVTRNGVVKLRDLVIQDPVALKKWPQVVDNIVKIEAQALRIKKFHDALKIEESVLQSLRIWHSFAGGTLLEEFVKVCRQFELNALAAKLQLQDFSETDDNILPQKWWPERKLMINAFVPRTTQTGELLVDEFRNSLNASNVSVITAKKQAVVGMGGIGKTSTAKWYANVHEDSYDHIIWIDAHSNSLKISFRQLAKDLGILGDSTPVPDLAPQIYKEFAYSRCLFVFDNADRFDGENGLFRLLPKNELHHSIITSRNHDWGNSNEFGRIPSFQLDVFTEAECLSLMKDRLESVGKCAEEEEILALARELGFLPLALQAALATIMKSSSHTVASYLRRIREDMKPLMDRMMLSEYERSISATLRLSVEQIERDEEIDEQCRKCCSVILTVAAFCEPNQIPTNLFTELSIASEGILIEALDQLVVYSLLAVESKQQTLSKWNGVAMEKTTVSFWGMHSLLQHVIRMKMAAYEEQVAYALNVAFLLMKANLKMFCFRRHAVHAWKLASTHFDQVVRRCHHWPIEIWKAGTDNDTVEFMKNSLQNVTRVFKEWELPVVQLRLSLVDRLCSSSDYEVVLDALKEAITEAESEIPYKSQLLIHLRRRLASECTETSFAMNTQATRAGVIIMIIILDDFIDNVITMIKICLQ